MNEWTPADDPTCLFCGKPFVTTEALDRLPRGTYRITCQHCGQECSVAVVR